MAKPNCLNFLSETYRINVLKHRLKVNGLRQSPWRTPRPKNSSNNNDITGVARFHAIGEATLMESRKSAAVSKYIAAMTFLVARNGKII